MLNYQFSIEFVQNNYIIAYSLLVIILPRLAHLYRHVVWCMGARLD